MRRSLLGPPCRALLVSTGVVAMGAGAIAAAFLAFGGAPGDLPWEEQLPLLLLPMPYAASVAGALLVGVAFVMRRLSVRQWRWLSGGAWVSAAFLVVGTLGLFGPLGGFHHMFSFGVLGYMAIDCDSPPEELAVPLGACGIRGSPALLVVTIVVWAALVAALVLALRRRPAQGAR